MRFPMVSVAVFTIMLMPGAAVRADFTLSLTQDDFTVTSVFNDVATFSFTIDVAETLVAGTTYTDPTLNSITYRVEGVLNQPTPSGFPGFTLVRSIPGADFYGLSPDASLRFAVASDADLTDGVQLSDLAGPVFVLNAREFNQNPGRYHPPILTLNADGTGRLVNADNQSTFPNPDPPVGSGMLVDVAIGDEYDVALGFQPLSSTFSVPLSGTVLLLLAFALVVLALVKLTRHGPMRP